jgi:dienelactone hydrolase
MLRLKTLSGVALAALIASLPGVGVPSPVAAEGRPALPAPRAMTLEPVGADGLADAPLTAWLFEPAPGQARGAAVVALHGCGGLYDRQGRISTRHRWGAERLARQGFVVLMPDSFTTRGLREICTQRYAQRTVNTRIRSADAKRALTFLSDYPDVRPDRIALLGWSNGGSTVLEAIDSARSGSAAHTAKPRFAKAVAFYPGCAAALRRTLLPDTPLLLLLGEADDWTPAQPCVDWVKRLGEPYQSRLALTVFPGAHHGFDGPGSSPRRREDVTTGVDGRGVTTGGHPEARQLAWRQVLSWLQPLLE